MSAYTCEQRATLRLNLPYARASRLPNLRRIFSLVSGLRNSKNACVYGHMMGAQPSRVLPASKKSDVCCAYPLSTTKTPVLYSFLT